MLEYQLTTIRAVFHTLLDSGMDAESIAETVGRVLIEKRPGTIEWNAELNQRRFELIDKEIQDTLASAERDAGLYCQLVGFPNDLPDLSKLKPPRNHCKEGLDECWFARRRRGELPNAY